MFVCIDTSLLIQRAFFFSRFYQIQFLLFRSHIKNFISLQILHFKQCKSRENSQLFSIEFMCMWKRHFHGINTNWNWNLMLLTSLLISVSELNHQWQSIQSKSLFSIWNIFFATICHKLTHFILSMTLSIGDSFQITRFTYLISNDEIC